MGKPCKNPTFLDTNNEYQHVRKDIKRNYKCMFYFSCLNKAALESGSGKELDCSKCDCKDTVHDKWMQTDSNGKLLEY